MRLQLTWMVALFFATMQFSFAQEKSISGTVTDESGIPLPGVSILVKESTKGTQTDFDGNYQISVQEGKTLVFSYVGMKSAEKKVGRNSVINVVLQVDAQELEDVVVVGYGTQKRSEVTASISNVKGEDIANLNTPSFEAQLAGKASGVQITQNTGLIGEAPRVRIRGVNSISSGTSPLYVVDGFPVFSGDTGGGYTPNNSLGDINPNDIESIEILKDGAATAIYGSRAANGVILINTKKGKSGKFSFTYNSLVSAAYPVKYYDLLETPDFLTISNEKAATLGQVWAKGDEFNTNWQKAVTRSTIQQDHYLSFQGGLARGKYFVSLGYTDQQGIVLKNEMERYTLRINANQKLRDNIDVGVSMAFAKTSVGGLNNTAGSLSGAMGNASKQLPNTPIYDSNNPTGYNIYNPGGSSSSVGKWTNDMFIANNITNIVYVLNKNIFTTEMLRFMGDIYVNYDITDWVTYRLQASADNSSSGGFQFWNKVHGDGAPEGTIDSGNRNSLRLNMQNILTFSKTFDAHKLDLTLVYEEQNQKTNYISAGGRGLVDDFFGENGPVTGSYNTQTSGGGVFMNALTSYISRFNYNYASKYFLQASIRRDGLSKLPSKNRWGVFPGVSVGWTISNEGFMEKTKPVLSDLKLRASYAKVGNTDIGNFPYKSLYGNAKYGDNTGLALVQAGNNNLKWETSTKYDYGLDIGLFDNRVTFSADYFINDQGDIILDRPISPSLGVPGNSISQNIGAVKNSGLELTIGTDIIRKEKFSWNINANISFVENKVISLVDKGSDIPVSYDREQVGIIREGEPIRSLYGYRYWGVNKANGYPVYYKADGSLVQQEYTKGDYFVYDPNNASDMSKPSSLGLEDKQLLGQTLPKYFGSISTSIKWNNFDFSTLVRFSGGNKVLNLTRRELLGMEFTNNSKEILGRWQSVNNPGDGKTPKVWGNNSAFVNKEGEATSRFVEDGSFVKIDNISIGYSLPTQTASKLGLSKLRVYTTLQNAFIFTKYTGVDPEQEINGVDLFNVPRQRTFSLGLNLTFN